jgi:hypothetical protein
VKALALALLLTLSAVPAMSEEYAVCYRTKLVGSETVKSEVGGSTSSSAGRSTGGFFVNPDGSGGTGSGSRASAGASYGGSSSVTSTMPVYSTSCAGPYEVDTDRRRMCPKRVGVVGLRFKTLKAARWWMDENCDDGAPY